MAMHKMVNGIKVDLSPEEEAAVEAEWAKNREAAKQKIAERNAKVAEQEKLKASAMAKLKAIGLDDAEVAALVSKPISQKQGG